MAAALCCVRRLERAADTTAPLPMPGNARTTTDGQTVRRQSGVRGLALLGRGSNVALALLVGTLMLAIPAPGHADGGLPDPAGATWSYFWSDRTYNPNGTDRDGHGQSLHRHRHVERLGRVAAGSLSWTGDTQIPIGESGSSTGPQPVIDSPDNGTMCFTDQQYGLVNTDWSGTSPQVNMPALCASATNCANSLSSFLYDVIWGARDPVHLRASAARGSRGRRPAVGRTRCRVRTSTSDSSSSRSRPSRKA